VNVCHEIRLLKQNYESALREEALYQCGGAASLQQSLRYQGEATRVSAAARNSFAVHSETCPICEANRA
jgi:hypothetical protein